jgi:CHAT domain-containing protein
MKFIFLVLFVFSGLICFGQKWEELYDETVRLYTEKQYEEALSSSDKTIEKLTSKIGKNNEDYCYILTYKATILYSLRRLEETLPYGQEAKDLAEKLFGKSSVNYGTITASLAYYYFELRAYEQAVPLFIEAIDNALLNVGQEDAEYLFRKGRLALCYKNLDQPDLAFPLFTQNLATAEKVYEKNTNVYIGHLYNMATFYTYLDLTEKAIAAYKELITLAESSNGVSAIDMAAIYFDLGLIYNRLRMYQEALPLYEKGIAFIKPLYPLNHWYFNEKEHDLALAYQNADFKAEALPVYLEVLDNAKQIYGEKDPLYAGYLFDLATLYVDLDQYENAVPLLSSSLGILADTLGKDDQTYQDYLNYAELTYSKAGKNTELLNLYSSLAEYDKGLNYLIQLMVVFHKNGSDPMLILETYLPTLTLWLAVNDYQFSEFPIYKDRFYTLMMEATKGDSIPENSDDFLNKLMIISGQYVAVGDYNNALLLFDQIEQFGLKNNKLTSDLTLSLNLEKSSIYNLLGQPERALPYLQESLKRQGKNGWTEELAYSGALMALSSNARARDEVEEGFNFDMEAYRLIQPHFEREDTSSSTIRFVYTEYPEVLGNLASYYDYIDKHDSAIYYSEKAIDYAEEHFKGSEQLLLLYNNLASVYQSIERYDEALQFYNKALTGYEKNYGKKSEYSIVIKGNICSVYNLTGKIEEAFEIAKDLTENINSVIKRNFSFLSEQQKIAYISNYSATFSYFKFLALTHKDTYKDASSLAYTIELATKGMVLNSGIEMRTIVNQLNDSAVTTLYNEWIQESLLLTKEKSLAINDRKSDIDELERKVEALENNLYRITTDENQLADTLAFDWHTIQEKLKTNEVAIEFATSTVEKKDNQPSDLKYMAIILKKDSPKPILVSLCLQSVIDSILSKGDIPDANYISKLYRGDSLSQTKMSFKKYVKLYDLIWKPLEDYIPIGSTVYYAPSGDLHQLAFAAIPKGDSVLSDYYNLIQLNTTARIVDINTSKTSSPPTSIALFGGIKYTLLPEELTKYPVSNEPINSNLAFDPLSTSTRGDNWNMLPGTLREVEKINQIAKEKHIQTVIYTDFKATEESFKLLSSHEPEVIHVSTHGFFFPDPDDTPEKQFGVQNEFKTSADPMNRSGLLFAGANNTWIGKDPLEGREDGILTAKEASFLTLKNTKLVVLSACETGLGTIKGSEGVFGLQRAFKSAGINYIMMSLWKVPDNETAEFMTIFYAAWFSGKSIRLAFIDAQNKMKEKYYSQPYKWAAFVLIE